MIAGRGPSEKEQWALIGRYGTVGIEMGLCVTFGWLFGSFIDGRFGSEPYGTNIGLAVGIAAAFKSLWRMYRIIVSDQEAEPLKQQNDAVDE